MTALGWIGLAVSLPIDSAQLKAVVAEVAAFLVHLLFHGLRST